MIMANPTGIPTPAPTPTATLFDPGAINGEEVADVVVGEKDDSEEVAVVDDLLLAGKSVDVVPLDRREIVVTRSAEPT